MGRLTLCFGGGFELAIGQLQLVRFRVGADQRRVHAARRERRCEHARRQAADAIERRAEFRLTDSRFDSKRADLPAMTPI